MTQKQKLVVPALPEIPAEWLAQLSGHIKTEHELSSLMGQLMKQLVERSLKAELTEHLSVEQAHDELINSRNGYMTPVEKSRRFPIKNSEGLTAQIV